MKKEKIRDMVAQLEKIIDRARALETAYADAVERVHPRLRASARNLLHYRALRETDLRDLQKGLGNLGLSRLAKAEAHVMNSLLINRNLLKAYLQQSPLAFRKLSLSPKASKRLHKRNAKALLGYRSKGRRSRIMVTLPGEAADDYQLVHDLIAAGMNCARINCAHDNPEVWQRMTENVRKASDRLHRKVKVCMDLGGPKIRTGPLAPGPRVRKFRLPKDERGREREPLLVWLGPAPRSGLPHLPMTEEHLGRIETGQTLYLQDTREKTRRLELLERQEGGFLARLDGTTYVETNLLLFTEPDQNGPFVQVGDLPAGEAPLLLQAGDRLRLHRSAEPGEPAAYDAEGRLIAPAHISCTSSEVFDQVDSGDPILFDDGRIEGVIREVSPEEMMVEIVQTPPGGAKLRADKGINLPGSRLTISGLTKRIAKT